MNALFPRHLNTAVATMLLVTASAWAVPAAAQTAFPATLARHAVLPALSTVPAHPDAPSDVQVSGKFTTGQRVDKIGHIDLVLL